MNIELYLSITSIVIIVITIVTGLEIRKTSKEINEMDIELKNIFKEGLSGETKRFVFAHACAHLINGDTAPLTRPLEKNKPKVEQLADYTAVALLMPLNQVYQYLELNNYQSASKGKKKKLVRELCEVYEVSEIIAIRRIKEVYAIQQKSF